MKSMLIIGRFQPFHSGHLSIIKKYYKKKYFIKLIIGSSQKAHQKNNPFTKDERIDMIEKTFKEHNIKNYKLITIPDTNCDREWMRLVKQKAEPFDVLFTGNQWVKKLFKKEDVEIHEFNEKFERIKGIKAKDIRKTLTSIKTKKGLPQAVYKQLKVIGAFDRLKDLHDQKKKVHYLLSENNLTISTAESCTGGAISRALISYTGSSKFFTGSIIAYNTKIKTKLLKVNKKTIDTKGVVSEETAIEMAKSAINTFKTNYSISTTGYADPSDKKSGKIWIAIATKNKTKTKKLNFKYKERSTIIDKTTKEAIQMLYAILKKDLLEIEQNLEK